MALQLYRNRKPRVPDQTRVLYSRPPKTSSNTMIAVRKPTTEPILYLKKLRFFAKDPLTYLTDGHITPPTITDNMDKTEKKHVIAQWVLTHIEVNNKERQLLADLGAIMSIHDANIKQQRNDTVCPNIFNVEEIYTVNNIKLFLVTSPVRNSVTDCLNVRYDVNTRKIHIERISSDIMSMKRVLGRHKLKVGLFGAYALYSMFYTASTADILTNTLSAINHANVISDTANDALLYYVREDLGDYVYENVDDNCNNDVINSADALLKDNPLSKNTPDNIKAWKQTLLDSKCSIASIPTGNLVQFPKEGINKDTITLSYADIDFSASMPVPRDPTIGNIIVHKILTQTLGLSTLDVISRHVYQNAVNKFGIWIYKETPNDDINSDTPNDITLTRPGDENILSRAYKLIEKVANVGTENTITKDKIKETFESISKPTEAISDFKEYVKKTLRTLINSDKSEAFFIQLNENFKNTLLGTTRPNTNNTPYGEYVKSIDRITLQTIEALLENPTYLEARFTRVFRGEVAESTFTIYERGIRVIDEAKTINPYIKQVYKLLWNCIHPSEYMKAEMQLKLKTIPDTLTNTISNYMTQQEMGNRGIRDNLGTAAWKQIIFTGSSYMGNQTLSTVINCIFNPASLSTFVYYMFCTSGYNMKCDNKQITDYINYNGGKKINIEEHTNIDAKMTANSMS